MGVILHEGPKAVTFTATGRTVGPGEGEQVCKRAELLSERKNPEIDSGRTPF